VWPQAGSLTKSDVVVRLGLCCLLAQASRWVSRVCAKSTYSCLNAAQLNHSPSQLSCILLILMTAMSVRSIAGVAGVCFPRHTQALLLFIHVKLMLCWLFFAGFGCQERSAFPYLISAGHHSCWAPSLHKFVAVNIVALCHSLSASQWLRTQIISTPSFPLFLLSL